MSTTQVDRHTASEARNSPQEIAQHNHALAEDSLVSHILDAMPQMAAILNENRQIVLVNKALRKVLKERNVEGELGIRPGEALACVHSLETEGGCGTAEACNHCGALQAVLTAQDHEAHTQDCFIQTVPGLDPLELRVTANPLQFQGEKFTILSIADIAREKRTEILERTFFHDILNTAGGVQGLAMLLDDAEDMEEVEEYAHLLVNQSVQMVSAIEAQRDMRAAERGQLKVTDEPVGSLTAIRAAMDLMSGHEVAVGKNLVRSPLAVRKVLNTGSTLLQRTLVNMVKNALEASTEDQTVTLGCDEIEKALRFWVHNETYIDPEVQLQIFKRSFSTRGEGRGIGTYSMKLLGERYLGGKVGFDSSEAEGTTFWLELPFR
jgi:signal transduction histidine kinase